MEMSIWSTSGNYWSNSRIGRIRLRQLPRARTSRELKRPTMKSRPLCMNMADFVCSAPYVPINMHPGAGSGLPGDPRRPDDEDLDAVYFSCHKFLGGPGTP